jgi:hypothetical protein
VRKVLARGRTVSRIPCWAALARLKESQKPVGQVGDRARMHDVKCSRYHRVGRLPLLRVLLELGANSPIRLAWEGVNADCPKRVAQGAGEACSLHAPILPKLFLPPRPE